MQREKAKMHLSDLITSRISAITDTTYHLAHPKVSGKAAPSYIKQVSKQKPGHPSSPNPSTIGPF